MHEVSITYGGDDANSFPVQFGISAGSELVGGDDHLQLRVLALKSLAGPVRTRACVCAGAGAGGSVGSTHVSGQWLLKVRRMLLGRP